MRTSLAAFGAQRLLRPARDRRPHVVLLDLSLPQEPPLPGTRHPVASTKLHGGHVRPLPEARALPLDGHPGRRPGPRRLVGLTLVVSSGTFRDAVVPLLDRIPLLAIPSRVVDQAYTVRSQQLLWVALPLFGAAGLSWLLDRLRSARPFLTVLPYVLLLGVLVVVLLFRTGDIRERYVHTFENHPVYAARYDEAQKAAEYLRPLVEPTSVVLVYVGKNGGWLPAIDSVIGLGTGAR